MNFFNLDAEGSGGGGEEMSRDQVLISLPLLRVSHSVVSDSLGPHGLWPARLLHLWDFSSQEYWSGLPFSSTGDFPDPGIEPKSPLQADSLPSELLGKPLTSAGI